MADDAAPTTASTPASTPDETARAEGSSTTTTTDTTTVTTTPAPPQDDLVTTRHTLAVGRRRLHYTATTGRVVLREEVFEDDVFKGLHAKAELSITAYVVDAPAGTNRPVTSHSGLYG